MKTYADILNTMNAEFNKAFDEVNKLENNFIDTSDIIHYLNTHYKLEQIKEKYFSFFTFCLRQNIDLNKEFSID